MQFKNIALIGKYQAIELIEQVLQLAKHLKTKGFNIFIDSSTYCAIEGFGEFEHGELDNWLDNLDLVIIIGGDGTMLSVARTIVNHDIPIIGINQGKLGFMTDISIEEMSNTIDDMLIRQNYTLESRTLLSAKVIRNHKLIFRSLALNDVVISRGAIGNMIEFDITIDKQFVLSQKSDGVIFSTPTGSTAYSLAAGGAILHPHAHVFSMVSICPQSLTNRPLVVNDDVKIEFTLIRENATQIHFDGQECFDLLYQDQVVLTKHNKRLKILHPTQYNYYRTLRRKFDWSKRIS